MKNIKVGELEVPSDYFSLPQEDKDVICNSILESIMYLLEKHVDNEYFNRKMVLERIIESSIITNEMEENYEVAGVLFDVQKLINA
jgi:predicted hydrolase (HD superfamily)